MGRYFQSKKKIKVPSQWKVISDKSLAYGLSPEQLDNYSIDELRYFVSIKSEHENELLMNIARLMRWQAVLILKGFSKEGIKESDLLLPDEIKEKKDDPDQENRKKQWAEKADKFIKKWQGKQ